ncbi:MAG: hypothetical protein II877_05065 [Synergistaceae bacterium]|nr:hypothetical protein [Synergistaceae bacterium]
MAGKFSVYLKDDKLKRDIEAIARFDRVSLTQLMRDILQAYADTRADDIAVIYRQDAEIDALKQKAQEDQQEQPEEQASPKNPNFF